jgi:hypothetical protein
VNRDQLTLRGQDGRKVPSHGLDTHAPLTVGSGERKTFQLEFMTRGGMSCTKPMQLDADSGVFMGPAPVKIGAVTFVPAHA